MKWVLGILGIVFAAGCISPVMTFGSGKTAKEAQHDTLNEFVPTQLAIEGPWRGPVMDARIRVYADDDFRAQNRNWRQVFGEELEYANAVLGANFGLHLVADYREWNHHAPGAAMSDELDALQKLDDGGDVLSVIGLTSSLSLVSATFDQLGLAYSPGKHVLIRGYADLEERKSFAEAFPDLPAAERENALVARRQHKTAAVLLHELAHNLGAPHERAESTLMNASYSERAASFSSEAHSIIQREIDQRLGRSGARPQEAQLAAAAPPKKATKVHPTMIVHVTAGGVLIDGEAPANLSAAFRTQAATDVETEVIIQKDKDVLSGRVIEVIDRAKASGLTKFSIR